MSESKAIASDQDIQTVKSALSKAERVLVITGAGISAESNIPTFRSEGGWWRSHDPVKLATQTAFDDDPVTVWEWYDYRRKLIAEARPNPAHESLAAWERAGKRVVIITQNVDDLHERAGSSEVIHIHGSIWEVKCERDGRVWEDRRVPLPEIPPRCECGGRLRPNVVWFDEELPEAELQKIEIFFREAKIDLALVIGTEATFDYVREYARAAQRQGSLLVEINPNSTPLTRSVDIELTGKAGELLPLLGPAPQSGD
jgi:NAD-dependent deacetylase